jgi:integrase
LKVVQPIRDLDVLDKCYDIAREHDRKKKTGEVSWELILLVGFNTSLRVSDFRRFKVQDIRGKDYAQIQAKKTGKEARILINPTARREINRLLAGRKGDEYIFQSRQRDYGTHRARPVSRQRVYQIMNAIAKGAGIEERIGCHTLRKTFGYHYYKMTGDVVSLQRILCHSYQRETLVYIGVIQENIDESLMKFNVLSGRKRGKQYDSRGQDSSV